mgnify:CR=1 FL=1
MSKSYVEITGDISKSLEVLRAEIPGTMQGFNSMAKDVPIAESYRGVMPFLASDVIRTVLLLLFPPISLWLVQYVG